MYSDKWTDKDLLSLTLKIGKTYAQAAGDVGRKAAAYFAKYKTRYLEEYTAYQNGEYTEYQFKAWVRSQIARGKRWTDLRDDLAARINTANESVAAMINGRLPAVFCQNANYEQYLFAMDAGIKPRLAFDIYNERAVARLIKESPQFLPFAPTRVETLKDQLYYQRRLENALNQAIIQGKPIDEMAQNFLDVAGGARGAAVRNARTAYTSAQNAGRNESFYAAADKGIEVLKSWTCTLDEKTRESHRDIDGETVLYDDTFSNGLMHPGDVSGDPSEVWNCRCTSRRVRPDTVAPYTTYNEWLNGQKAAGHWAREFTTVYDENGERQRVSTLELARANSIRYKGGN